MLKALLPAFFKNFLGRAPSWYKVTLLAFLLLNPLVQAVAGSYVAGWLLLSEFIFTLAMALRCYPLQPGGLLVLQAVVLGLTTPEAIYRETEQNINVLLLLVFMVAGIYFMRDLLLLLFTRLIVSVRSKVVLSLLTCFTAAFLSAFLDALTVMAVMIAVATGFYAIYHQFASGQDDSHDHSDDALLHDQHRDDLERFRSFLRSLLMHGAVGTALGGVMTLVGEPQNLLIGEIAGWNFREFAYRVAPVSLPVLATGLIVCAALEKLRWFSYGELLPGAARGVLERWVVTQHARRSAEDLSRLGVQAIVAVLLVLGLAFHVAEVGLIGLTVIILTTAFCGVIEEKKLGAAFEEALPFTALLVTFFGVVAIIHDQHLFKAVIESVLAHEGREQLAWMYVANGALSAISDNVFVATVYINEVREALGAGLLTRNQFDLLAVAINTGTNIPSIATPNGQAAFLFLLTSALAPLIRLGYGRMTWMALPYTIALTSVGLVATAALK